MKIIINRPDGGQSVVTNPLDEKLKILVSPQEIEIIEEPYLVFVKDNEVEVGGELKLIPEYKTEVRKVKKITKEAVYRDETNEEWLQRVSSQALENCKVGFGEGDYILEIINN